MEANANHGVLQHPLSSANCTDVTSQRRVHTTLEGPRRKRAVCSYGALPFSTLINGLSFSLSGFYEVLTHLLFKIFQTRDFIYLLYLRP